MKMLLLLALAQSADWPAWRGPTGNGIAADGQTPPVSWNATKNIVWKTSVPGRGHSSPTVVGNRIFLTTADKAAQIQSVVAFDRTTGRQVWKTDVHRGGFPRAIHPKNSHASPTVACDGERLFASFFNSASVRVTALGLDGKKLWQRTVGPYRPQKYQYGYAPSPAIYKSFVLIAADVEAGGFLAALDRKTGRIVWRTPRPAKQSYSSPIVATVAGRDQLLISGCDLVSAYDPNTGKRLWSTPGTAMATCGTMVWEGGLVFASGGYPKAETICVRGDGSGRIVWKNTQKCYEQSMLVHEGHLYAFTDPGIGVCWKADDGTQMWKARLGGKVSASPVLAGGNIYASNEKGKTFVFRADPSAFKQVARNQLGDEGFPTLSICGNRIYLRTATGRGSRRQETLYCIGTP